MILPRLLSICFAVASIINGQVKAQFEDSFSLEEMLQGHSVYIINDELEININGKENFPNSFLFKRKVTYKILNEAGITKLRKSVLPEDFDPTYVNHGPRVKKLGVYYSGYNVRSFEVSIKRSNKFFNPKIQRKVKNIESFNIDYLYEYDQHIYTINDLEVGDEMTIKYHVEIPMSQNYSRFASYRLFFCGDIPKLKYAFVLSYHESLDIELYKYNSADKEETTGSDHMVKHQWKFDNLPGCIHEAGARPYTQLPYVAWVLNQYKYYVHNSMSAINIPHYAVIAGTVSPDLFNVLNSVTVGSRSPQYEPFNDKFEEMTGGMVKDHTVLKKIHNHITEEFKYQNDLEYYQRNDFRGERLGEFFENKILRDESRYDLYFAILVKTRSQFYSAFIIDKRSGEVSDQYFKPNFDNDFLLATYFGEHVFDFILPKKENFGWYYNELPFYYENNLTRLVHITDYALYDYPIKEKFRSTTTPEQPAEDNIRNIEIAVDVDLDFDSLYCKGVIQLSGQFSTMTRGPYNGGEKDPSINSKYHHKIWNIEGNTSHKVEISNQQQVAPYLCEVNCDYDVGKRISGTDGSYEINLSEMFVHILPESMDQHRFLTYYSDFQGQDVIKYTFRFNRPVKLENDILFFNKDNDYAGYQFQIRQIDALNVEVISTLKIFADQVSAYEYSNVKEIIEGVNKRKLLRIAPL